MNGRMAKVTAGRLARGSAGTVFTGRRPAVTGHADAQTRIVMLILALSWALLVVTR